MLKLKKQNAFSIIKTVMIVGASISVFFPTVNYTPQKFNGYLIGQLKMILFPAIVLPILIHIFKFLNSAEIVKPKWTDNPFLLSKPLIGWQFISYSLLSFGLCTVINDLIKHGFIQQNSIQFFSLGIGTVIGVYLTLYLNRLIEKYKNTPTANNTST